VDGLEGAYHNLRSYLRRAQHGLINRSAFFAFLLASAEHRKKLARNKAASIEARRKLAAEPHNREALTRLGDALRGMDRHREAVTCYEQALMLAPENKLLWQKRAAAIQSRGEMVRLPDRAINPPDANSWVLRAGALAAQKRFMEAAEACDRALELDPQHFQAIRIGIRSRIRACDWQKREDDRRQISKSLKECRLPVRPLTHRRLSDSEEESLCLARLEAPAPSPNPLWRGEIFRHEKIRLAYVCAEFYEHALAFAIAGMFEHHDKARFELFAVSTGKPDTSEIRRRIESAFDHFMDVGKMTDIEIARTIRSMDIDIAIDLSSFAGEGRLGIFSHRPAPIQVNYLGYPGTLGSAYFDYIIADPIVIPSGNLVHYAERAAWLPHSYQPTDNRQPIPDNPPSRSEAGLPESGMVFACFNQEAKFSPQIFSVWMNILRAIEGSVLWLLSLNRQAAENLRREASSRGISPERIVFARPLPRDKHLARIPVADLFLDTLPYNAHATSCDALWAGLPVLTCIGQTFAGRVAASGLHALGLTELVTDSLPEYEKLAIALAQDPARLAAIREKLKRNRFTEPLFDTPRYTRNLESAYIGMYQRQRHGLPPESFTVIDGAGGN
jgi:predicted O-linked N-acetylglucosamine transferase (SPINDLY family)